jgi:hypothetical protein
MLPCPPHDIGSTFSQRTAPTDARVTFRDTWESWRNLHPTSFRVSRRVIISGRIFFRDGSG